MMATLGLDVLELTRDLAHGGLLGPGCAQRGGGCQAALSSGARRLAGGMPPGPSSWYHALPLPQVMNTGSSEYVIMYMLHISSCGRQAGLLARGTRGCRVSGFWQLLAAFGMTTFSTL